MSQTKAPTESILVFSDVHLGSDLNMVDARFPVQYVLRPQSTEYHDFRGYAGRVEGGVFKPGDEVLVLPSGFTSKVKTVETFEGPLEEAFPPMSVTMTLEDEIDISRGDMIVKPNNQPEVGQDIELMTEDDFIRVLDGDRLDELPADFLTN